jgi:hypothetical protein
LFSSDAGFVVVLDDAGRRVFESDVLGRGVRTGGVVRRRGPGLGAARRRPRVAARFAIRFMPRLAGLFAVFFLDAFLLDAVRDFAAVFAVFRLFLAMRAPPDEWARVFYLISSPNAC